MKTKTIFLLASAVLFFFSVTNIFSAEIYVDQRHPKAADTNPGTQALPLKTIAAAAAKVQPGDTVWVQPGIYRESVKFPVGKAEAPIKILARDKNARPVITGSEIVPGPWSLASVNVKYQGSQPVKIYTTPLEPYTQMVFVDEKPIKQIGPFKVWPGSENNIKFDGSSPEDMRPGTFYYDQKSKLLYLWLTDSGNPSGRTVECSVRDSGIYIGDYTTLNGFEVRYCQVEPNKGLFGIGANGKRILIENCFTTHNGHAGIIINGEDGIVRNCEISYSGCVGFTSSYGTRMLLENNVTHDNNTRNFLPGWGDGGTKIHEWKDSKVLRHHAYRETTALWFDINCLNILVADCLFEKSGCGIYFEISRWGILVNNVIRDCGRGIWSWSSDVLIANNVVDRCGEGITVTGELRGAEYSLGWPEPPKSCLPATRNNLIVNNIIIDSPGSYIAISKDSVHCGHNYSDYNVFVWTMPAISPLSNHIKFMAGWDEYYGRLQFWQNERHQDSHSVIADPTFYQAYKEGTAQSGVITEKSLVGDPLFTNREKGDYRLKPESPLLKTGIEIPATLASVYYPGKRPWAKTLMEDAPDPATAKVAFEAWGLKHYRYQPEPAPFMMLEPDKQKTGSAGLINSWSQTGKYPQFAIVKETVAATQPTREFTSIVNENLIKDPRFDQQTQNGTILLPWVKSAGLFHPWAGIAFINLHDFAPAGLGYQEVGKLEPDTRYTLSADTRVVSALSAVTTTGRFYLAVAPFSGAESGKVLQAQDFVILGKIVEVKASPKEDITWRTYQTVYVSGVSGQDKNVGLTLYVVLDGKIEGSGINSNNGVANGQTAWDNLSLLVER